MKTIVSRNTWAGNYRPLSRLKSFHEKTGMSGNYKNLRAYTSRQRRGNGASLSTENRFTLTDAASKDFFADRAHRFLHMPGQAERKDALCT